MQKMAPGSLVMLYFIYIYWCITVEVAFHRYFTYFIYCWVVYL